MCLLAIEDSALHSCSTTVNMSAPEVEQFLTRSAVEPRGGIPRRTRPWPRFISVPRRARDQPSMDRNVVRARMPIRVPVVLPRADVQRLLDHLEGEFHLI